MKKKEISEIPPKIRGEREGKKDVSTFLERKEKEKIIPNEGIGEVLEAEKKRKRGGTKFTSTARTNWKRGMYVRSRPALSCS